MKRFRLQRLKTAQGSTLGALIDVAAGEWLSFVLEDGPSPDPYGIKVPGETRIPAGEYKLTLRKSGTHHKRYSDLFPGMHRGMVHVNSVPGFSGILVHIGNSTADTAGCLLLGQRAQAIPGEAFTLYNSRAAYCSVYPALVEAIESSGAILEVVDHAA